MLNGLDGKNVLEAAMAAGNALGRSATADETAAMAAWILSDEGAPTATARPSPSAAA